MPPPQLAAVLYAGFTLHKCPNSGADERRLSEAYEPPINRDRPICFIQDSKAVRLTPINVQICPVGAATCPSYFLLK